MSHKRNPERVYERHLCLFLEEVGSIQDSLDRKLYDIAINSYGQANIEVGEIERRILKGDLPADIYSERVSELRQSLSHVFRNLIGAIPMANHRGVAAA